MEHSNFENSQRYRKARKQAREIREFYIHVLTYCLVIPLIVFINLNYTPDFYWFPFSMLGWGCGLLFHGMAAYGYTPFLGRNWEEKKIAQFMEEERAKKNARQKQSVIGRNQNKIKDI